MLWLRMKSVPAQAKPTVDFGFGEVLAIVFLGPTFTQSELTMSCE